jgi:hypothetical protein
MEPEERNKGHLPRQGGSKDRSGDGSSDHDAVAALTIYDVVKAVDRGAEITASARL